MIAKTATERQRARREREKQWLKDHNLTSWESLHTKLMDGTLIVTDNPMRPATLTFPYIPPSDGKKRKK